MGSVDASQNGNRLITRACLTLSVRRAKVLEINPVLPMLPHCDSCALRVATPPGQKLL